MQETTVAKLDQPGDPTDKPIRRRIRQALSCQRQVLWPWVLLKESILLTMGCYQ